MSHENSTVRDKITDTAGFEATRFTTFNFKANLNHSDKHPYSITVLYITFSITYK